MLRKALAATSLTFVLVTGVTVAATAIPIDVMTEVWSIECVLTSLDCVNHDGGILRPTPTEEGDLIIANDPEAPGCSLDDCPTKP